MPVTEEEKQKYFAFVQEQVNTLKTLDVHRDDRLWHYTTGDALLGIIDSGTIFATQVSCLNDSTEVRYGENLLRDAFLNLHSKGNSRPPDENSLLERIVKNIVDGSADQQPSDWFVTCFSEEKDDLSQWRAYGGGENGYAVSFLAGPFFARGTNLVVRVNYDRDSHLAMGQKIAETTLLFYREGRQVRLPEDGAEWEADFLKQWGSIMGRLAPMVKDPSFDAENEVRIVHEFQSHEMNALRFRQKHSLMSVHLPLVAPPTTATRANRLPIMEIMVGPGRHKEISRMSVDVLLRKYGYFGVPVSMSKIPFQTT